MLSKVVVQIYTILLEIGLWLILLSGFIGGWQFGGFWGAIGGLIAATVLGSISFGALLVLNDIRAKVNGIEEKLK